MFAGCIAKLISASASREGSPVAGGWRHKILFETDFRDIIGQASQQLTLPPSFIPF
jgi:hypothetical protein